MGGTYLTGIRVVRAVHVSRENIRTCGTRRAGMIWIRLLAIWILVALVGIVRSRIIRGAPDILVARRIVLNDLSRPLRESGERLDESRH